MQNLYGNLLLQVPPNDASFISLSIHDLNDSFSKPKIQDSHKNPSHLFQSIKVTFHVELPTNKFLTGISLSVSDHQVYGRFIRFSEVEGFDPEENNWRRIGSAADKLEIKPSPTKTLKIAAYGVCQAVRICFVTSRESLYELFPKGQMSKAQRETVIKNPEIEFSENPEWKTILAKAFDFIQIHGYDLDVSPIASQVVPLLNISNILHKANRNEDATESEILLGLSLISARRFLQAAEILRKVSDYYIEKAYPSSNSKKSYTGTGTSSLGSHHHQQQHHHHKKEMSNTMSFIHHGGAGMHVPTAMMKAAKIEILICDGIVQHSMINLKVEALQRAAEYSLGQKNMFVSKITPNYDVYTALLKLTSPLSRLLIKCLEDKLEPVRIASLKTIEFLIDTLGTNLGSNLAPILKQVVLTYPDQSLSSTSISTSINKEKRGTDIRTSKINLSPIYQRDDADDNDKEVPHIKGLSEANYLDLIGHSARNRSTHKALIDAYNHMLENFMNMLPNIIPQTLHMIFNELVVSHLFLPELLPKIRNYFVRMTERIVTICGGDLSITVSFYTNLLNMLVKEQSGNASNKPGAVQKLWDVFKNKAIVNMENRLVNKLIEWLTESLYQLAETEITDHSTLQLQYLLELVPIICSKEKINPSVVQSEGTGSVIERYRPSSRNLYIKDPLLTGNLVKPLIAWLDRVVNSQSANLELFKGIWVVLTELIYGLNSPAENLVSDIALPLLWKIHKYCETSTPTHNMLKSLVIILSALKGVNENIKAFLIEFIPVFVECIPHSTHDESFAVFDLLLRLSANFLDEFIIQKCILALLDQYTMKGKAQKQSKEAFIRFLVGKTDQGTPDLFYSAIKICLLENVEPVVEDGDQQTTLLNTISNATQNQLLQSSEQNYRKSHTVILDSKQFAKRHDIFQDKLQFVREILSYTEETNFTILFALVASGQLQVVLERFVSSGNSKVRLQALEILKEIMNLFITCRHLKVSQEKSSKRISVDLPILEFELQTDTSKKSFNTISLAFCRFALPVFKIALDQHPDSKIQHYCLTLLEKVFSVFLPSPGIKEEIERIAQIKKESHPRNVDANHIEGLSLYSDISISYVDDTYLHYRLNWILRFWAHVQSLTEASCINIRTLSTSLICYWVKPDLTTYAQSYQKRLKGQLFTLLMSLLTSKESDLRYWGLMILGSLCGMNYNFDQLDENTKITDHLTFFQKISNLISLAIWEIVYDLQKDWNNTNRDLATGLIQLAAPKDSIQHFYRLKKEGYTLRHVPNNATTAAQNVVQDFTNRFNISNFSQFSRDPNILNEESSLNFSNMLKNLNNTPFNPRFESPPPDGRRVHPTRPNLLDEPQSSMFKSFEDSAEEDELPSLFWLEYCPAEVIKEVLSYFRIDLKFTENYWTDKLKQGLSKSSAIGEGIDELLDRFYLDADELESPVNYKISGNPAGEIPQAFSKHLEEEIDLDDLGIIDVEDDEDWLDHLDAKESKPENKPSALRVTSKGKVRPESHHKRTSANSPDIYTAQKRIRHHQATDLDSELNRASFGELPTGSQDHQQHHRRSPQNQAGQNDKGSLRPYNAIYRPLTPPVRDNLFKEAVNNELIRDQENGLQFEQELDTPIFKEAKASLPDNLDFEEEEGQSDESPLNAQGEFKGGNLDIPIHFDANQDEIYQTEAFYDKMEPPFEYPLNAASSSGTEDNHHPEDDMKRTAGFGNFKMLSDIEQPAGSSGEAGQSKPEILPQIANITIEDYAQLLRDKKKQVLSELSKIKGNQRYQTEEGQEDDYEEEEQRPMPDKLTGLNKYDEDGSSKEQYSLKGFIHEITKETPLDPCPSPEMQYKGTFSAAATTAGGKKESTGKPNYQVYDPIHEYDNGEHDESGTSEDTLRRKTLEKKADYRNSTEEFSDKNRRSRGNRNTTAGRFGRREETKEDEEEEEQTGMVSKGLKIDTDELYEDAIRIVPVRKSHTTKNSSAPRGHYISKGSALAQLGKVHSVKNFTNNSTEFKGSHFRSPNIKEGMRSLEDSEKKQTKKIRDLKGITQMNKLTTESSTSISENKKSFERKKPGQKSSKNVCSLSYVATTESVSGGSSIEQKIGKSDMMRNIIKKATNILRSEQKKPTIPIAVADENALNFERDYGEQHRSTSVEKAGAKYFNLPDHPSRAQGASQKGHTKKGSKEEKKKIAKLIQNRTPSQKKVKEEKGRDNREFFPRKINAPLKNNFLYGGSDLNAIDENYNQTL